MPNQRILRGNWKMEIVEIAPIISKMVETGGLGGVVFLLLRWILTQQTKEIRKLVHAIDINAAALIALQKMLLAHDLTVTGINPSTGVDLDERATAALNKYQEIQLTLDNLSELIKCNSQSRGTGNG